MERLNLIRNKVAALRLWEASRLSFGGPLPGKPPNIPNRFSSFPETGGVDKKGACAHGIS